MATLQTMPTIKAVCHLIETDIDQTKAVIILIKACDEAHTAAKFVVKYLCERKHAYEETPGMMALTSLHHFDVALAYEIAIAVELRDPAAAKLLVRSLAQHGFLHQAESCARSMLGRFLDGPELISIARDFSKNRDARDKAAELHLLDLAKRHATAEEFAQIKTLITGEQPLVLTLRAR